MICSTRIEVERRIASEWPELFIALNHHRNTHGEPMDLVRFPAQVDIFKDDSQFCTIMKCVQVGVSEVLIIKAMVKLLQGWSIIYSLPIESLRNTFVANRIDKTVQAVPLYRDGLKRSTGSSDQVGLKHFWNGSIKFVGSNAPSSFLEYPADMVIEDERDKSNIANLELAADRLKASEHKYHWKVGNPSVTKYGIHADYLLSDQKEWHVKCSKCRTWQYLDFFKNVVREIAENEFELIDTEWSAETDRDIKVFCANCGNSLSRFSLGSWVARYPDRKISGYHFSQLFSPTVTIREIYEQFIKGQTNATAMQVFYNSCLGLPHNAAGTNLTAALLEAKCMDDYLMPSTAKDCTAGIDVNWPQLNVRISDYPQPGIRRAVYIGVVHSFAEVTSLLKQYNVKIGCFDVAPERHKIAEYQKSNPNIWAIQYSSSEIPEFWRIKPDEKYITVDRTQGIDGMIAEILSERNRLPKNFRSLDGGNYIAQMEAPTRIYDESKNRYRWDEGGNPDHHFHADVYDYLAMRVMRDIGDRMPRLTVVTA